MKKNTIPVFILMFSVLLCSCGIRSARITEPPTDMVFETASGRSTVVSVSPERETAIPEAESASSAETTAEEKKQPDASVSEAPCTTTENETKQTTVPATKKAAEKQTTAPATKKTAEKQTTAPATKKTAEKQTTIPATKKTAEKQTAVPATKKTAEKQTNVPATKKAEETTTKMPEPQTKPVSDAEKQVICTIEISCKNILKNKNKLKENKLPFLPAAGVILSSAELSLPDGSTAFDALKTACAENSCVDGCVYCQRSGIQLDYIYTPGYDNYYIRGIHQLYEKDCGSQSGWMFSVNGVFPDCGCSQYTLQNGDTVSFLYTCDLGSDLGAEY